MTTEHFKIRDFDIFNMLGKRTDACAQFLFQGYLISMSTIGLSQGGCHQEVCVFAKKGTDDFYDKFVSKHNTVEEAVVAVSSLKIKEDGENVFTLYWHDGEREVITGFKTVTDFVKSNSCAKTMDDLEFYAVGDDSAFYWDVVKCLWERIKSL
jgi:hypothetical protein